MIRCICPGISDKASGKPCCIHFSSFKSTGYQLFGSPSVEISYKRVIYFGLRQMGCFCVFNIGHSRLPKGQAPELPLISLRAKASNTGVHYFPFDSFMSKSNSLAKGISRALAIECAELIVVFITPFSMREI